jgi:hypothetical protein
VVVLGRQELNLDASCSSLSLAGGAEPSCSLSQAGQGPPHWPAGLPRRPVSWREPSQEGKREDTALPFYLVSQVTHFLSFVFIQSELPSLAHMQEFRC